MTSKTADTFWADIYLSGPIDVAKQVLREDLLANPLCVTVTPTTFLYTGGEEVGYVVGVRNYPRFPEDSTSLSAKARRLAELLLDKTFQTSAMVVTPHKTYWISKRKEN
ncbi:MAG: hypothetical protein SFU83_08370 [Meiothermus sp.]|nr:hypothetical protein [Meiothermus sp.]